MNAIKRSWREATRRQRIAAVLALLYALYALIAVCAGPVLRPTLEREATAVLHRPVTIETLAINPLLLAVRLDGVRVRNADGSDFAGWHSLVVNVSMSSILRRALVFDRIDWDAPYAFVEQYEGGTHNIDGMFSSESPEHDVDAPAAEVMPVMIGALSITGARARYRDSVPETPADIAVGPINFRLNDFKTISEEGSGNDYEFIVESDGGGRIEWHGEVHLTPLLSKGTVAISNIDLSLLWPFIRDAMNVELQSALFDASVAYRFQMDDTWHLKLNNGTVALRNVHASDKSDANSPVFKAPKIALTGIDLDSDAKTIDAALLESDQAAIWLRIDANGQSNLAALTVAHDNVAEVRQDREATSEAYAIRLGKTQISHAGIHVEHAIEDGVRIDVAPLNVTINDLDTRRDQRATLILDAAINNTARLDVSGDVLVDPLDVQLRYTLDHFELPAIQPYVAQQVNARLKQGSISANGAVRVSKETITAPARTDITTDVDISGLSLLYLDESNALFDMKALALKGLHLDPDQQVTINRIEIDRPVVHLSRSQSGELNIASLIKSSADPVDDSAAREPVEIATDKGNEKTAPSFALSELKVNNGAVSFVDHVPVQPFSMDVSQLVVQLNGVSNGSALPSAMTASAVIDQTAALSLKGSSREKDHQAALDIQAQIKSLELVGFTPYSGQYIGREIDQGQLNLDVHYDIQGQQLVGKNKVRFNRFILGDKVESPDAANLPVDLALALMRDKNGVIDLDFGVSGDMSAPAFSFAGLIWKALGNLIVKAAASPFALLPNLSGTDIDIEHVFYVPGSSVLADGEIEKLDLLVTALQSRPTLAVQVIGSVDAEDRMALQVQQLQKAIYAELSESAPVDEQAWQRNKNFLKRLEARYQDQVGQGSAALHEQWQQAQPMLTADERHAQALDAMLHAVAAKEVVPDSVVLALALARSRVVSAYLIEKQLPPEAVFVMTAELAVGVTTLKLVAR